MKCVRCCCPLCGYLLHILLVPGFLGGCTPNGLEITGELGANLSGVQFPHHSLNQQEFSLEHSRWTYQLIISDDSDLCESIAAEDSDNIFGLDSVAAVVFTVFWVGPPLAEGKVSATASRYDVVFEEDPVVGERAMLLDVLVKKEGEYTLRASSSFDLSEFLPAELDLGAIGEDQLPSLGTFSSALVGDVAWPERNDVDVNDDGVPDYRALHVEISASFEEPVVCGS